MAQGPSDYILVIIRITVRMQESEIRIHWITEKVPSGLRSKLHSQFALQKSFSNSIMLAFGGGLCSLSAF